MLIVFLLYWFPLKKSLKGQNVLLLVASYYFYSCWDWRFLFLLVFSTLLDYYSGIKIDRSEGKRAKKFWLVISIAINLSFLGLFKYYNFFADSFVTLLQSIGFKASYTTLNVILPVGISFYTFHGLSYVLDVYNQKIRPRTNFVDYSLFVSFFPLLVAGPIERATHLLPQVEKERSFDYSKAIDGLRQMLWGLFKKVVIADGCAEYANMIFNHSGDYNGSTLVLGAFFFTIQIYCDFSGYSDIALGTARLFGFELLRNFAFPYFSRDIAEFWRRWHISLSSWFRDYLYFPLGGSKGGLWMKIRNTFIIFLVSGFWHGANWTFVFWGALNAIYFLPLLLLNRNRNNLETVAQGKVFPTVRETWGICSTFLLAMFAWIFFRAESLSHAFSYIGTIFSGSLFKMPQVVPVKMFVLIFLFMIVEWFGREQQHALARFGTRWPSLVRYGAYYCIILLILAFFGKEQQFIYFQF
ncbi:MBOAT family O-acyltransferase [Taibaiella chishuiensis]|uniref:MBOAT family O-acyltransferase n=1 Tax=Taibaiella chishuiensis TaxID=1434707 RepID=UPI001FEC2D04|nr:MBOAT family O-acyltransferase [Taibaiella chishuiensis]